jgi:hypothetical protein
MRLRRKPRRRPHSRALAATAGLASTGLIAAESVRLWRRGSTPAKELQALKAGYQAGTADDIAVLNLFVAFGATFAVARTVTHSIRRGVGPLRNVHVGRRHIHHFVPGILLVLLAGGASIGVRREGVDQWLAVPFGAGAALIIDETALLLELQDVYWSSEGVLSIDAGLGGVTALACLALLLRTARRGSVLVSGDWEVGADARPAAGGAVDLEPAA